ncbi:MAG: ferrous iron transport protein A [Bacteroidia bacterium]|nr:ferrous iron transport protein A [Bacteroidia bacterium]
METVTAAELKSGERAKIIQVYEGMISQKLLEMGCIPGTEIALEFTSPAGDPIALNIDGYILGLRLDEAKQIEITLIDN